jgi:hypothetical protein
MDCRWDCLEDKMKIVIERSKPKAFVICPVRNVSPEFKMILLAEIAYLEKYYEVYYPARDTDQNDDTGFWICNSNLEAIKKAKVVFVTWDGQSQGSLFDLGMAFALKKKIKILSDKLFPDVFHGGKSFENMVRKWEEICGMKPDYSGVEFPL